MGQSSHYCQTYCQSCYFRFIFCPCDRHNINEKFRELTRCLLKWNELCNSTSNSSSTSNSTEYSVFIYMSCPYPPSQKNLFGKHYLAKDSRTFRSSPIHLTLDLTSLNSIWLYFSSSNFAVTFQFRILINIVMQIIIYLLMWCADCSLWTFKCSSYVHFSGLYDKSDFSLIICT